MLVLYTAPASAAFQSRTYTFTEDFDDIPDDPQSEITKINVVTDNDEVKLDDTTTPFNFIWVAVSTKGTVVKIDTNTGEVLGEYRTAPEGMALDPSRTTVDKNGNVWVSNRAESGFVAAGSIAPGVPAVDQFMGSVTQIGLIENGQCVDRNLNGTIETSTGLNDILSWTNAGGVDTLGGADTADDECVLHYTRVRSTGARHVSVDANNDVWVSGTGYRNFDLVDGETGAIVRTENGVGYGGYGGLIDANGVIWSTTAGSLLRWDTSLLLGSPGSYMELNADIASYGLCIDSFGNVWNTSYGNGVIRKMSPAGAVLGTFPQGNSHAQGCVVDGNDDVWVAHSLGGNSVGHLNNDGTFVGTVPVGNGPTGVAVDAAGKVWATNYFDGTASRIDPAIGAAGGVDFTTVNLGGNPYDYSDMTGSTLIGAPTEGTWAVVYDSGEAGFDWSLVGWNADVPGDAALTVAVAVSNDGVTFSPPIFPVNGADPGVVGRYLRVTVSLTRATPATSGGTGASPILYDLTIEGGNEPPDCSAAAPSIASIWPPNHQFVDIQILGITDPDGDAVAVTIDSIYQDEPVDTYGDGSFVPDGYGVGTDTASVRAERSGTGKVPGDGRVYHISFTADDGNGGVCSAEVTVAVPHDNGTKTVVVDGGALYDSTGD